MPKPILAFCLLLLYSTSFSQRTNNYLHPSTLGVSFVLNDFTNESLFGDATKMDPGISIGYLKGISSHFDYSISLSATFPDSISKNSKSTDKSLLFQGDFSIRARAFGKPKWINPFVQFGVGALTYRSNLPVYSLLGPGIEFNYKDVFLTTCFQYRPSFSDNLNNHLFYSIGISGFIGKKQKTKSVKVTIPSIVPTIARDTDGDGIVDSLDACPTIPGLAKYHGCPMPDRDKDGIADEDDSCPDVPGIVKYHGCPVPDTDGDGINDEEDSCITVPGVRENHGCPAIKKEIKESMDLAAKNVFFKTGSYELLEKSFRPLDDVAKILADNPSLTLTIEGHTDNVGSIQSNQTLSENRANAVLEYLVKKGIDKNRLIATGYGQLRPVATNLTPEGRSANRRVEFKLTLNRQ